MLRSVKALLGHTVLANDGEIGKVHDIGGGLAQPYGWPFYWIGIEPGLGVWRPFEPVAPVAAAPKASEMATEGKAADVGALEFGLGKHVGSPNGTGTEHCGTPTVSRHRLRMIESAGGFLGCAVEESGPEETGEKRNTQYD